MQTERGLFGELNRWGNAGDLDTQLLHAFSNASAIALAIIDNDRRYRFVNDALVAMHNSIPTEAFIGRTFRDILEDAAPETEARFQQVSAAGETPPMEVTLKLPSRIEVGYWIEKNLTFKNRVGRVTQIASLAVEVTETRKLDENFRKLSGELLRTNTGYQRLARELHDSISEYH